MKDHRQLAQEMDLFHFEEHSPGMVFWHPNGTAIYNSIQSYMRSIHTNHGYNEIRTPMLLNKELWEKSGHWSKFHENMFTVDIEHKDNTYALKPMSCPAHIEIFKQGIKSYNDLPMRYMEFGVVHRNESSGSLNGCLRLRHFNQDDSHIFCRETQILDETKNYINIVSKVYKWFGFDSFDIKISLRGDNRIGSDESWDKAEQSLRDACDQLGLPYTEQYGEAAFYGPKIEVTIKDNLGRDWQCGTIQVDFNLAERLGATYVNENNEKEYPVILHHAVLGSLERWIGVLLEHTQGKLPSILNPYIFVISSLSNSPDIIEYSNNVKQQLIDKIGKQYHSRIKCEFSDETIGKKIKKWTKMKAKYMIIIGKKEIENNTMSIRNLHTSETVSFDECDLMVDM